jgi:hypothetical protein
MVGQFDESFYKSKRAAIVSSLILIGSIAFSLRIQDKAELYFLKIDQIPNHVVILLIVVVFFYLNVSYFLRYATEIPRWMRDPEGGLKKVDEVRSVLESLREQNKNEQEALFRFRDDANKAMLSIANRADSTFPGDLANNMYSWAIKKIKDKRGDVYAATFNNLSAAFHKDSAIEHATKGNLSGADLADKIIADVSSKFPNFFKEGLDRGIENIRNDLLGAAEHIRRSLEEAGQAERARLSILGDQIRMYAETERKLRRWRNAMNIRLRVQYLYLPVFLFVSAGVYAAWRLGCQFQPENCLAAKQAVRSVLTPLWFP